MPNLAKRGSGVLGFPESDVSADETPAASADKTIVLWFDVTCLIDWDPRSRKRDIIAGSHCKRKDTIFVAQVCDNDCQRGGGRTPGPGHWYLVPVGC